MAEACIQGIDIGFATLSYGQVAGLGIIQGLTELLPISSTAHMRLVPAALGWRDPGSAFSAAMQLAALAAVLAYFWADVRGLAAGSMSALRRRDFASHDLRTVAWICLATIPIGVSGLLISKALNACGSSLRTVNVIGWACLLMAVLLAAAELSARHSRTFASIRLRDALIVGIAQVGALIPGVSRSGSTLTAALWLGLKREDAARFSFLLGVPAITLAGLKEVFELWRAHLDTHAWLVLGLGLSVAAVSAFLAIWSLMRILERFSAWPFVIYRALLGVAILAAAWIGAIG